MRKIKNITITILILLTISYASSLREVIDLNGTWRFYVGDDLEFAQSSYNDDHWDKIHVPDSWEDEGFPGYDGFCWYRYSFDFTKKHDYENFILNLGFIDDVDEVYFNGKLIGRNGNFPPNYVSASNKLRLYNIPLNLIKKNRNNVIAVRVYDNEGPGGIKRGKDLGIFVSPKFINLLNVNLNGIWKFKTGYDEDWSSPNYNDSFWNELNVPGDWDSQGYSEYDGFGWYRKSFHIEESHPQHMILTVGKIDDFDEVYVNGYKIGQTMPKNQLNNPVKENTNWRQAREYYVPKSKINWNGENTVAICVYDGIGEGGIREGSVELLTREEFQLRKENNDYNLFDILELIFD